MNRLVFAMCVVLASGAASAATYTINPEGTGDFPTIQAAVDAVDPGDIIELSDGVFTGVGNRDVNYLGKAITIRSQNGDPETCVIDCAGSPAEFRRAFVFSSGEDSTSVLAGITITGGWFGSESSPEWGGGVLCILGSSPLIENCRLIENSGWAGAGIGIDDSSPIVRNCVFEGNVAEGNGGGILSVWGGEAEIVNCWFESNEAQLGAGVYVHNAPSTVNECVFVANVALDGGGGLYRRSCGNATIVRDCIFLSNIGEDGGGFASYASGTTYMENCTFYGNVASTSKSIGDKGAAVCAYLSDEVVLSNCIISSCAAGEATYGDVTIICCDVFGNADGNGTIDDQLGFLDNIDLDPRLCDPEIGDVSLRTDSPCAPINSSDCGLIGAVGIGCGLDPAIAAIADVPADQGGWVDVSWSAAYGDLEEVIPNVDHYEVYRRTERKSRRNPTVAKVGREGSWEMVESVPATGATEYEIMAPTLGDSSSAGIYWSTFYISAVTDDPQVFYDSEPDSGYSVDNLAPPTPDVGLIDLDDNWVVTWQNPDVPDLLEVCVYRGHVPDFEPDDPIVCDLSGYYVEDSYVMSYYVVQAVDIHGNTSEFSEIVHPDPVGVEDDVPLRTAITRCYPNPFNPRVTIEFTVANDGPVEVAVYSVDGRRVRRLVATEGAAGGHTVAWDGRSDSGGAVPAGTYFCRLTAGGESETAKMVLVR